MTSNSGDKIIKKQVDTMQVSFDKEAAWLRLQDRMESKDERRRPLWMGWAAAAVVLLATVIWYGRSETKQVVVKEHTTSTEPVTMKQEPKVIVQADTDEIARPKADVTVVVNREQKQALPKEVKAPVVEEQLAVVTEPPMAVQEIPLDPDVPAVVEVPKKKMKRVHINDVAEDDRTARRMARERIDEQYAAGRKYGIIKPATEREDADKNSYSLFGANKTDVN